MPSCAYLYLAVPRHEADRFKVGRSVALMSRFRALGIDSLDLARSLVLRGSPRHIAKAESALHFMLESWRSPHPHGGDGHTEWFSQEALDTASAYVRDLASRDDRFHLVEETAELLRTSVQQEDRARTRGRWQCQLAERVNERTRDLQGELAGLRGHVERLCGEAAGVIHRADEGEVILVYERLRGRQLKALSSVMTEANIRGENVVMVPGISVGVLVSGRWQSRGDDGEGRQTLYYEGLTRVVSVLQAYRGEAGIDVACLDAVIAALEDTLSAIHRALAPLPVRAEPAAQRQGEDG